MNRSHANGLSPLKKKIQLSVFVIMHMEKKITLHACCRKYAFFFFSLTYTVYMQFIQAQVQLCAVLWKPLPTWGVPSSQAVMVSLTQYCLAGSTRYCQAWAPHRGSGCVRACMMRAAGTRYFSQPIIILWHCATPCICVWVGVSDWVREWMNEWKAV